MRFGTCDSTLSQKSGIDHTEGVTSLLEYIFINGTLLILLVVIMFTVNAVFMEGPANTVSYYAFTDIGNGVSTRIVDLYLIFPFNGTIDTRFDIPDDVLGQDYLVETRGEGSATVIEVRRGDVYSSIPIAGIGGTRGVVGNTTGRGWNRIYGDSQGVDGSPIPKVTPTVVSSIPTVTSTPPVIPAYRHQIPATITPIADISPTVTLPTSEPLPSNVNNVSIVSDFNLLMIILGLLVLLIAVFINSRRKKHKN